MALPFFSRKRMDGSHPASVANIAVSTSLASEDWTEALAIPIAIREERATSRAAVLCSPSEIIDARCVAARRLGEFAPSWAGHTLLEVAAQDLPAKLRIEVLKALGVFSARHLNSRNEDELLVGIARRLYAEACGPCQETRLVAEYALESFAPRARVFDAAVDWYDIASRAVNSLYQRDAKRPDQIPGLRALPFLSHYLSIRPELLSFWLLSRDQPTEKVLSHLVLSCAQSARFARGVRLPVLLALCNASDEEFVKACQVFLDTQPTFWFRRVAERFAVATHRSGRHLSYWLISRSLRL